MTEVQAALLGALIGALSGLAGGGFAALASLRASQTAARLPLCSTLFGIAEALIRLRIASENDERTSARLDFEKKWNEFSIQQRILCPSRCIEALSSLILAAARNQSENPEDLLNLSGQVLEKITRMVGAHSNNLFRWRAKKQEIDIIQNWLNSPESQILSANVRSELEDIGSPGCPCFWP